MTFDVAFTDVLLQAFKIVLKNHHQTSIKVNREKGRQNSIASNVRRRKQQEVFSTFQVNFTNKFVLCSIS